MKKYVLAEGKTGKNKQLAGFIALNTKQANTEMLPFQSQQQINLQRETLNVISHESTVEVL